MTPIRDGIGKYNLLKTFGGGIIHFILTLLHKTNVSSHLIYCGF